MQSISRILLSVLLPAQVSFQLAFHESMDGFPRSPNDSMRPCPTRPTGRFIERLFPLYSSNQFGVISGSQGKPPDGGDQR